MAIPHFINDDKSEMRGIKTGWYAIEDDGNLSSGPFSSREQCVIRVHTADERFRPRASSVHDAVKQLTTDIRPALRARGTGDPGTAL